MKIIIAGCGIVGTALAKELAYGNHSVTVIDKNEEHIAYIQNALDVLCITGNATSPDVLEEAGCRGADLFIAVTDSDEENLLACLLAGKIGVASTIARARSSQSVKAANMLMSELKLSMVINPENDAAREIFNSLKYRSVDRVETLAKGSTEIITCTVKPDSCICGVQIRDIGRITGARILVCGVKKGDTVLIPNADTLIEEGDTLSFAAPTKSAIQFLKKIKYDTDPIHSVVIVGGSKLGVSLAARVLAIGIPVKIIDKDEKKCRELINLVPEAEIIRGDGTDADLIEEENILESSVVAAVTEDDPTNVMIAVYVSRLAPNCKTVIKIKKSDFEDLLYGMNLGSIYNPKHITVNNIIRYVRAMHNSFVNDDIESMYRVIDNKIGILEFNITDRTPHINEPLKEIRFRPDLIIATIYRKGRPFTPCGDDMLRAGDIVIVATTYDGINRFSDVFA